MQQEKLAKKAEAADLKKIKQWEKGKFALKSIVAEIDAKVVELGSVGGAMLHLLSSLFRNLLCYISITFIL